jgi:Beta-propeller repeat
MTTWGLPAAKHRHRALALSLILVTACSSNDQSELVKWAVSAGGTQNDSGWAIAVDSTGNIYVTGRFEGTATFGSTTLTSKGDEDIFVARVDNSGKALWVVSAGGTGVDRGSSIAVDASGSSYVTGWFEGTATFGSATLTSKGDAEVFVAKLDSGGKFVWAVSAGGTASEIGNSIAVDGSGNSYITGGFEGTATFGSTTLTSKEWTDIFVAKLDSGGKFVWAVSAGGPKSDDGSSIAVDGSGNSYVTGTFWATATFGSTTLTSKGDADVFVAKLDSGGKLVWAVSAGGPKVDYCTSIALDDSGNSYVTGTFWGTATFGSTPMIPKGGGDIFVAKLDTSGNFLWAVPAGGAFGSSDVGYGIAIDASGSSYVTGWFEGTATFGSATLTSKGDADVFVAKLDSGGKFVWAVSAGGPKVDYCTSIALDDSGNSYVIGYFYGRTATFGSTTLTSNGGSDIFIVKLDKNGKF